MESNSEIGSEGVIKVIQAAKEISEVDRKLKNPNLSESERRVLEIGKECGLKRMI